jgi:enoyl-CoA hydratase
MLAGESIGADEAMRLGFVNRVVEEESLLAASAALARSIIETAAPLAARACLEAVTRGTRMPLEDGLKLEAQLFAQLFSTEDVREGTRAFLEKRKPNFKGK